MHNIIVFCLGGIAAIVAAHLTDTWRVRRMSGRALNRLERSYKAKRSAQ